MSAPLLIMDKVSRIHGTGENTVHALTRVSLEVGPGELVAVMGPSGSGKSTLLNLAGALDQPTAGRVLIDGVEVSGLSAQALAVVRRRKVGLRLPGLQPDPLADGDRERRHSTGARRRRRQAGRRAGTGGAGHGRAR